MSKLVWDVAGQHYYETGVKNCVLYVQNNQGAYPSGVAWNGITGITESPSGADATKLYADDAAYLNLRAAETFGGTIEAYTYPEEFGECNGEADLTTGVVIGQQGRKTFGLCYRTALGNDTAGSDYNYKLHLVYGATCSPSERAYSTINDSPEAITFSWAFDTVPVDVTGHAKVSCLTIDMSKLNVNQKKAVEDALYGTNTQGQTTGTDPYLPLPDALKTLIDNAPTPSDT